MTDSVPPARSRSRPQSQPEEGDARRERHSWDRTREEELEEAQAEAGPGGYFATGRASEKFAEIKDAVEEQLQPSTALERIFAEDVVKLTWEAHMYRLARGALIRARMAAVVSTKMIETEQEARHAQNREAGLRGHQTAPTVSSARTRMWAMRYVTGKTTEDEMPDFPLETWDRLELEAAAYAETLDELTKIDVLIAKTEQRRHAALQQFREAASLRSAPALVQPVAEQGGV